NERYSSATLPIRINGLHASVDLSASITTTTTTAAAAADATPETTCHKSQHSSWWNGNGKDVLPGIQRYSYKEIQRGTDNFTTAVGQGSFGAVYRAVLHGDDDEAVAVKVLASNSKQGEKEFQTEVSLLARLHHRNLVNLVGYCIDRGNRMLIYEFMSNGSLENRIYNDEEQVLSWEQRVQIALDISHGIEYLHDGAVPPVIHRDLKSANILLDGSMRAKVADFGLSKEVAFDGRSSGLKGTFGYIDPAYVNTNTFTTKSDVYSFGLILFELITAIHPHQNLMEYVNLAAMSQDGVDEIIDSKMGGNCNMEQVRNLAKIAHKCLHKTPRKRPPIGEVSLVITKIKQQQL
ncbi:hypothetical protein M569_01566, partial [Genlisea aurea]